MQEYPVYIVHSQDTYVLYLDGVFGLSRKNSYEFSSRDYNGLEALEYILDKKPPLAVLEFNLEHLTALDIVKIIAQKELKVRCIVVFETAYFRLISGVILRSDAPLIGLQCIDSVAEGGCYISPSIPKIDSKLL